MNNKTEAAFVGVSAGALIPMGAALTKWVSAMIEAGSYITIPDNVATFVSVVLVVPLVMLWQSFIRGKKDESKPQ